MPKLRDLLPHLCAAVFAVSAASASAQEAAEASATPDADEAAEAPHPAAAPHESADDAKKAAADAPPAGSAANEETIFVVQAKPHLVAGKFEIAPQFVQSIGDQFVSHTGLLLSGIYHLRENLAVEVAVGGFAWWDPFGTQPTARFGGHPSDMTRELIGKENLQPLERADLYEYTWLAAADLQFSPLYGKVSFHDLVLGQFNVYVSVGAGVAGLQLESERPDELSKIPGSFGGALPPMQAIATLGGGVRFYFTDWLGIRLEVRDYVAPLAVYQSDVPELPFSSSDVLNTLLAQLGVSFLF